MISFLELVLQSLHFLVHDQTSKWDKEGGVMSGLVYPVHLTHSPSVHTHTPPQRPLLTHTPPACPGVMDTCRAESTAFAWCLTSSTPTWVVWRATSTSSHSA